MKIQSFREFISDFTKSLISRIHCNVYNNFAVSEVGRFSLRCFEL